LLLYNNTNFGGICTIARTVTHTRSLCLFFYILSSLVIIVLSLQIWVPNPSPGRVIRRAVKRRHAHPLVSRLEKDYLTSPTYHRSSPNLYQPDVVSGVSLTLSFVLSSFFSFPTSLAYSTFLSLSLFI